jgi:DNA primase
MPYIKKTFITDRLLPSVSIEQFINNYVTLKKQGTNYVCCCPFHKEKTPSFNVNISRQMYYCFGCKKHGNVIDFIMEYKNLDFVSAVEEVAQFAGLEVEYETSSLHSKSEADRFKTYYEIMDRCASLFSKVLRSEKGVLGLEYFKEKRELSEETITKLRLGYAPAIPNFLRDNLARNKNEEQCLIDLGMLVKGDYGVHDMYRNRVMIPIFDRKGRIISFGGRTMGDDKPKYLNTKETPIYHKRNELFGLYESLLLNNNNPERLIVVEGYMDVIAVRQAGCTTAVASLGTATTPEQIKMMFRYTDKIVFCYDGDSAGRHAAWHALEVITPILTDNKKINFAFLPQEHDPDSLVREEGLLAFYKYVDGAMSYPEFLVMHNAEQYNLKAPNELTAFIGETVRLISRIPVDPLRAVSIQLLSGASGIPANQLYDMVNKEIEKPHEKKERDLTLFTEKNESNESNEIDLNSPMRRLMAFVIQQPIVVSSVYEDFHLAEFAELCQHLEIPGTTQLNMLLRMIEESPELTPANLIEHVRDTEYERIVDAFMNSNLNLTMDNGRELSFKDRLAYFGVLLKEVLLKPLRERAEYLKTDIANGSLEALAEHSAIQKLLN